jgi:hypothetical protein
MWSSYIAKNGQDYPAFTTVGRWMAKGHALNRKTPVFLPWIYFDIDNPEPMDSWSEAQNVIDALEYRGYDIDNVVVAFSGRKGFHVQVPSYQFGAPVFASARAARWFARIFIRDVTSDYQFDVDESPSSPLTLIRLIGSKHGKTDAYKTAHFASDFRTMSMSEAFAGIREHTPFDHIYQSRKGRPTGERFGHVKLVCERMKERKKEHEEERKRSGGEKAGTVIKNIKRGLREGETFGDKYFHVGRENGAFILACWFLERGSRRWAYNRLKEWNDKNDPPLPQDRLQAQFRGGERKLDLR